MFRRSIALPLLFGTLLYPTTAFATWSIVAVDRTSGRVTMSLATCFDIDAHFLSSMVAVVAPGKGIAACQGTVDPAGGDQKLIFEALKRGEDPEAILLELRKNSRFALRQFGIVDLTGRVAADSGERIPAIARAVHGRVPGTEIYYSIQGNTLTTGDVVPKAEQAFIHTKGLLTDRAMAALEAGDRAGGDSRCKCEPGTQGSELTPPCDGRHSRVAFILMSEPENKITISKDEVPSMFISVSPPGHDRGADQIRLADGDSMNPVKTLRQRYNTWRANKHALMNSRPTTAGAATDLP